jgi:site-specific DNA-cytosine methylase
VSRREVEVGQEARSGDAWRDAALWSGGFPCQDLSVAGKRAGFDGKRSVLAFAFLDLVRAAIADGRGPRGRGPEYLLLENVPGLLSSHAGRDMAALLGALVELGYGVAYRVLDARHFGVPQRRRRVFIVGVRSRDDDPDGRVAAERAAAVLAVGTRCRRHPPTGAEAGEGAADEPGDGAGVVGTFTAGAHPGSYNGQDAYTGHLIPVGAPPDPDRVRATDELPGRLDDRAGVEPFREVAGTVLSSRDGGTRTTDLNQEWVRGGTVADDPLLPPGLDSHRYRCCGNGVVSNVAEWIGRRLMADALASAQEDAA